MAENRRLLKNLRRGDRRALRLLYEKYKDDLLTVAMGLLGDIDAAEDCLQDVFVRFAGDAGRLNVRRNLKGYLLTCIANRARDRLRKDKRQPMSQLDESNYPAAQTCPAGGLVDCEKSAQARVFEALRELPYGQREVVTLHTQGGLTFRKIADLQGESINTIQSRYRYGIKKLRELLKKEYEND